MLPQIYGIKNTKAIHINPNFKGQLPTTTTGLNVHPTSLIPKSAHINPLFLDAHKQVHSIHMNPAFLKKFNEKQQMQQKQKYEEPTTLVQVSEIISNNLLSSDKLAEIVPSDTRKIICKSKNRIVREPAKKIVQTSIVSKSPKPLPPILVLNKRKLIRKTTSLSTVAPIAKTQDCNNTNVRITKYRLDNRMVKKKTILPPTPKIKRTSFVGRYALRRTSLCLSPNIKKGSQPLNKNINKKLQVLNINGLLYKSTKNSLRLKDLAIKDSNNKTYASMNSTLTSNQKSAAGGSLKSNQGLTIFVRGTKYVMDANKYKLTRIANPDNSPSKIDTNKKPINQTCKRIYIGGYTYVTVNSAKNILVRTTNHLSRAYVHNAKQKSLHLLTKHLVKSNIPCPIYQRVGKCAAFERGKCSKVHNKLQVAICSKFLRGECLNSNCFLSHNVSLSKMPVCKFFLQGVCVRNDCPYLHKKLSNKAELCNDFLRGFCQLADKCNKRHEFVCPEIEKNKTCLTKNCIYCKAKRRKESQIEKKLEKTKNNGNSPTATNCTEAKENASCKRYFIGSCNNTSKYSEDKSASERKGCNIESSTDVENTRKSRPKLGALPAYIPL